MNAGLNLLAMGYGPGSGPGAGTGTCWYATGTPFGMVWVVLLLAAVGALLLWVLRRGTPAPPQEETALDILNRRYAKGEISDEEYEAIKKKIS